MELYCGYDRNKTDRTKSSFRYMTVGEAKKLNYGDHVPFKANDGTHRIVKINGQPKTWKRSPGVAVPVKYGMYEHATFEHRDGEDGEAFEPLLVALDEEGEA